MNNYHLDILVNDKIAEFLQKLADEGVLGSTREEVAHFLIMYGLQQRIMRLL